jgi:exopolyphosphatase/guanosine-5'-triphosphate,3'-diphosphate pyrophosphatase
VIDPISPLRMRMASLRKPPTELELVAAIDLGSNSFHMIVARYDAGQLKILDRLREPVRLAAGLDHERRIGPAAEARAVACLERFGQRLRGIPAEAIRAVGTNTLRRARNSREFMAKAERALGHTIEVVSGIEEARLIYLGVAHSLADDGLQRLVIDIGGGSTELIVGERFSPRYLESLHLGCVSVSHEHFPNGTIDRRRWEAASLAAHMELELVAAQFRELEWERAVGASGTVKAIGAALRGLSPGDHGITLAGLRKLREVLLKDGRVDRDKFKDLSDDRAEVFAGGVAVLLACFEALAIERMDVADGALREGLIYDLLGRFHHEDVRGATVDALTRRYHVDRPQAERVAATAQEFLDQVAEPWGLNEPELPPLLSWAALLHEIGLDIAHNQYHKHGAYVLWHADMAGFSRQEQQLLAMLVRVHRRKFAVGELKSLPERWQEPLKRLAILLRLAVLLHRARSPEPLPGCELQAGRRELQLAFPDEWLGDHPLLRADLEQEAAYLKAGGIDLKFE